MVCQFEMHVCLSRFQDDEDVPGVQTQRNVNGSSPTVIVTGPQETDPVFGSNHEHITIPMPPSYESTSVTHP